MNEQSIIEELRKQFPSLDHNLYFNTARSGPMPQQTCAEIARLYQAICAQGSASPAIVQQIDLEVTRARKAIAEYINADQREIAFIRSISEGVNMVSHGIDWSAGDEVIISDQENPALSLPWYNLKNNKQVIVKKLHVGADQESILKHFRSLITRNSRAIAISHITHSTGTVLPIKEISAIAKERGLFLIVDGAQAVGQIETDMRELGCDCYLLSGHKWLFGLYGTAALYLSQNSAVSLAPSFVGVGSQKSMDPLNNTFLAQEGAMVYEYGSRHWPLYVAWSRSVNLLNRLSLPLIRRRVNQLTGELRQILVEMPGVKVVTPNDSLMAAGIITFLVENADPTKLVEELWSKYSAMVAWRDLSESEVIRGIRVSVAWFNTSEEIEQLTACLSQLIKKQQ